MLWRGPPSNGTAKSEPLSRSKTRPQSNTHPRRNALRPSVRQHGRLHLHSPSDRSRIYLHPQIYLHPRCLCLLFPASAALFTKQVRVGNIGKECTSAAADLSTSARSGCITMRPLAMSVKNFVLAQRGNTGRKFTIGIAYHVNWAAAQLSNATECPSIAN